MSQDFFKLNHKIGQPSMGRKRAIELPFGLRGKFDVEHHRGGLLLAKHAFPNDITNIGKNTIFDVMFSDATQIAASSWFIGLINITGYSALAATDTASSHGGWTEFTTYSEANRVAWGPGDPAAQAITNASPATFSISGSGTVKGIFVISNNTKSGTTGILWSTGLFNADVPVVNGDELKVTYTVNA